MMPRGDGTGPLGQGPGTGMGGGRQSGVKGRSGGIRPGAGPAGYCFCSNCGQKAEHRKGVPCSSLACPKCGSRMVRE